MIYRKLAATEHEIQASFISEIRLLEKLYPVLYLMFAVPNAGKRSFKTAAMLLAEGLRAGVPDIMFPVPGCGFNGLAIEFKRPTTPGVRGGRLSDDQVKYINLLTQQNWLVVVLTDAQAAIDTVKNYLGIKR